MISVFARNSVCVALLAGYALAGQAQENLVKNPGFDISLVSWDQFTGVTQVWSSEDADGSDSSGSALLDNVGESDGWTPLGLSQCIRVEPDTEYEYGGDIYVPAGNPSGTAGYIYVQPYASRDCLGNYLIIQNARVLTPGRWISTSNTVVTESDTLSLLITFGVFKTKYETAKAEAYFDNIFLSLPQGEEPPVEPPIDPPDPEEPVEPEEFAVDPSMSVVWFNPAEPGHGIMLSMMDAETAWMCWFAFDPEGNPVWICGVGVVDGDTITFEEVFTVEGGAFPPSFDAELVSEVLWGSITITFTDCESGVMSWTTNDMLYESGEMPIVRLTDLWNNPCGAE